MFKLRLFFCVFVSVASLVSSSDEKRSHRDPWAPRDCWDHGDNFLMNPFCPALAACDKPPTIENGRYSDPELTLNGLKVIYTCNEGYSMKGGPESKCAQTEETPNPVWNPVPKCVKPIVCGEPLAIQFGNYSAPDVAVPGSQANYTCDAGYRFDSENTSVVDCEATGNWSSPTPVCVPIECPLPPAIDFGTAASNDTYVGALVEYDCFRNYTMGNVTYARCLEGGVWTSPLPICSPPDCYPIPTIDYGRPIGSENSTLYELSTLYGNSIEYVCEVGYEFTDTNATTCLISGYWSVLPECVRMITGCDAFPVVKYANISDSSNNTDVGATATYLCFDGYEMIGNDTVKCISTSIRTFEWTRSPRCALECSDLPRIAYGGPVVDVSPATFFTNGSIVDYACNNGYIMNGTSSIECVDGYWTETPFCKPNCVDIDVVFLVDGSGSVGEFGFMDTRRFLTDMIDHYPINSTRFGMATFSTGITAEFNLNAYVGDRAGLVDALNNTKYPTGNTNTDMALEFARTDMFQEKNGMRPDTRRAAIVITDGESNYPNRTLEQAELLKAQNVTIFSVGVGIETNPAELRAIASSDNYVFNATSYGAIQSVSRLLSERTCTVPEGDLTLEDEDEYEYDF